MNIRSEENLIWTKKDILEKDDAESIQLALERNAMVLMNENIPSMYY